MATGSSLTQNHSRTQRIFVEIYATMIYGRTGSMRMGCGNFLFLTCCSDIRMERKGVGKIGVKYLFSHLSQIYCCQGSSVHFTWKRIPRTVELVVAVQRSFPHHFDNPPRSHVRPDGKYVLKS
ncbi:hypothetical protein TNCV_3164301 [Trichonephila clavipes]|nr:hypothetical protein TNCV_3164301 [Trichonephila clavipes]